MKVLPLLVLSLTLFTNFCVCWWDTGHMLVAKIAELTLLQEESESFELAEKITNILNPFSHGLITNFAESACWPDDVKKYGLQSLDEWHYLDLPVRLHSINDFKHANITYKVDDALGTLHQAYKVLTKWTQEEVREFSGQFEKSMMARYFIHVAGDVHQPLHASALFDDDKFKNGDQGGNFFLIKYKAGIQNLHKLFDSVVDGVENEIKRPLDKNGKAYLEKTAKAIMKEFAKDDLPEFKADWDFADWLQESHDISQSFIYTGIKYNSSPSEEYLKEAFEMTKRRIALGGYRVAEVFKKVLSAYKNPVSHAENSENSEEFLKLTE